MGEDKSVWIVESSAEEKICSELEQKVPGAIVSPFKSVCDAVDALRAGHKPAVILGSEQAWDIMIELAHQPTRYAGIIPAYVSCIDLSHLAQTHHAGYVRINDDGSLDGLADFIKKWAQ
jgi:hypothetical protein